MVDGSPVRPAPPRLVLTLRPHLERDGYHLDRFDTYLNGELVCTSRSGWHDPARKLIQLGYPPETLLHVQHEGRPLDPPIKPRPIGELAKWIIKERDRGGLHRERFQPFPVPSPAADDVLPGTGVPQADIAA
jgi:hypothetical protein